MDDLPTQLAAPKNKTDLLASEAVWFPAGPMNSLLARPNRRGLFIASSRLSKKLDEHPQLFDALRTAATRLDPEKDFLVTSSSTTCDRFVKRIGSLFKIPTVQFESLPKKPTKRWTETQSHATNPDTESVFVKQPNKMQSIDELLMAVADDVLILSARANGNVERAAMNRLAKIEAGSRTRILVDRKLTSGKTQDRLLESGAVAWWLFGDTNDAIHTEDSSSKIEPRILTLNEFHRDDFLLHWTRRCQGPWPDQSEDQYLDDLIFACERKDHREVATLFRILATQRLLGSNRLTRDPRSVVCFSQLKLSDLLDRRVFRSHLSRWDFEPFGVAIEKRWLKEQGARQVIYGDEEKWNGLTSPERPYFQLNRQRDNSIDWREELEWRIAGDLDLRNVPAQAAVAFVPDRKSAELIAPVCRWPIVVLS